ncbi:MAG: mechanosensitive ion channel family protein [Methyloligellaceae bacterium]
MKWILLVVFIALGVAGYLGYLDPAITLLQSQEYSLKVGENHISAWILIKGLFSIVFLFWLASIISQIVRLRVRSMKTLSSTNKAIIGNLSTILIYIAAVIMVTEFLGVDITALAVFSGAIGIGLGFGLQKITSNFISGIILLFEKSVKEGDLVQLADGTKGIVRHSGPRFVLIEGYDGKEVMVPNEEFITNSVINMTYSNPHGRIEIPIGISYSSDPEKARQLMIDTAASHPRCSKENKPQCFMTEFGDSSINFVLHFWVDDVVKGLYGPRSDVMFAIWNEFNDAGIEIPFPQRDVHVKSGQV